MTKLRGEWEKGRQERPDRNICNSLLSALFIGKKEDERKEKKRKKK